MSARTVNNVAALIREVDGDNTISAADLGQAIGRRLADDFDIEDMGARAAAVASAVAFVARTNPDKRMGAGRLAELIVAEFDLDKEQP